MAEPQEPVIRAPHRAARLPALEFSPLFNPHHETRAVEKFNYAAAHALRCLGEEGRVGSKCEL